MGQSFGEVLGEFKSAEDVENIVPLMNNSELQSSLIAWKSVKTAIDPSIECEFTEEHDKWEWLWAHTKYDPNSFAIVAGLRPQDAGKIIVRLIGLRLIYPDGTINNCAKLFLQGMFKAHLEKMSAKPGRPKKNP